MDLHFPKARLFAYDKLTAGHGCFSVLVQAVADAGLISEDSLSKLKEENAQVGQCGSLHAAKKIIDAYMSERHHEDSARVFAEVSFNELKSQVEAWQKNGKPGHGPECVEYQKSFSCRDTAPIVLDLLLQKILRH